MGNRRAKELLFEATADEMCIRDSYVSCHFSEDLHLQGVSPGVKQLAR